MVYGTSNGSQSDIGNYLGPVAHSFFRVVYYLMGMIWGDIGGFHWGYKGMMDKNMEILIGV